MHSTLITAAQLSAHTGDTGWFIADVRHDLANPDAGRQAYAEAHIPGACFLHLDEDLSAGKTGRNGRHPLPSREAFAARMAEMGLHRDTQVVAYDAHGGMFAARLWWMLRWIGHEAVAVLDGGLPAWQAAGLPVTDAVPAQRPHGNPQLRASRAATRDATQVLALLGNPAQLIVDARAPDRYRGENETLDPVGGHIPGARNRFFKDNLAADGCFKSPVMLREEWGNVLAGADPAAVVHQCGSGVTACHNLLALEVAGLSGGMLYPGSWSEWCADPARPIER